MRTSLCTVNRMFDFAHDSSLERYIQNYLFPDDHMQDQSEMATLLLDWARRCSTSDVSNINIFNLLSIDKYTQMCKIEIYVAGYEYRSRASNS